MILICNAFLSLLNLFITEKTKIKVKTKELKEAKPQEQCEVISSFLFIGIGPLILNNVYEQTILSHSTTKQRKGYDEFILKEEELPNLLDDIEYSETKEEIGLKLIRKFDLSNRDLFQAS